MTGGAYPASQSAQDATTYVFSGNYAAVVGAAFCALLLLAWVIDQARTPIDEEES